MEVWKEIKGYEGLYQVSSVGRLKSLRKETVLTDKVHTAGYLKASLYKDRKYVNRFMHTLVLEAFVGRRPEGFQACHNNGNKKDNRLENLRWASKSDNQKDREAHGTGQAGKSRPISRLNDVDVQIIKAVLAENGSNRTKTAKELRLSRTTINDIASGRTWRNG